MDTSVTMDTEPSVADRKLVFAQKKVPLHLCPPAALVYMAVALREGAGKYGAWNFREGEIRLTEYVGATMRHLMAYLDGETLDINPDTGYTKPHLAGALASLAILVDATESGQLIDDRPGITTDISRLLESWAMTP